MSLDHLKTVHPGDYVTAEQWNALIAALKREHTGPALIRTPGGYHTRPDAGAGIGAAEIRWAIVREIVDPADLSIKVEYARRGRNFSDAENPDDYGRWVGEHEHARWGPEPPDESTYPDYLHEVSLLPHTVANDYTYFLFPHAYDPENPATYRDTHVDDTDLVMLVGPPNDLIAVPVYRDANVSVDSAARQHDCIAEE